MHGSAPETITCSQCGMRFRWKAEAAGRTIRCVCGAKVRCPDPADATTTAAAAALDDTVADVTLDEAFDAIEEVAVPAPSFDEAEASHFARLRAQRRGAFGLRPAGETLFWGVVALMCVSSSILALIVGKWFYAVAAALTAWGAFMFYRSWRRWKRGRPWLVCLAEAFGEQDEAAGA